MEQQHIKSLHVGYIGEKAPPKADVVITIGKGREQPSVTTTAPMKLVIGEQLEWQCTIAAPWHLCLCLAADCCERSDAALKTLATTGALPAPQVAKPDALGPTPASVFGFSRPSSLTTGPDATSSAAGAVSLPESIASSQLTRTEPDVPSAPGITEVAASFDFAPTVGPTSPSKRGRDVDP